MARPRKTPTPAPGEVAAPLPTDNDGVAPVNTAYLESLIGYNARRTALTVISLFVERMAVYGVGPVDFSVLSLIRHNPGITSRVLCASLGLLPPNLVVMVQQFEQRGLLEKRPHPHDGRAIALYLTPPGEAMMAEAEQTAFDLEIEATSALTDGQRNTLRRLLKLVYAPGPKTAAARSARTVSLKKNS
jgi:DNA-binding MarR family transcriptional regulator